MLQGLEEAGTSKSFWVKTKEACVCALHWGESAVLCSAVLGLVLHFYNTHGVWSALDLWGGCVCTVLSDCTVYTVVGALMAGMGNYVFFFLCTYFFCLLGSLVFLLWFSMQCYTLTDNIVVTGSSFVLCSFFMVLFYTTTKESVSGGVVATLLATFLFIGAELFIIALVVILQSDPDFFRSLFYEATDALKWSSRRKPAWSPLHPQ
ncbi:hypothetical protein NECID01_1617 [Nematocida sp. AWRm77]|nr:hypothetical protein NECID01_1617 [Nematocida sp. AWRm77]